MADINVTIHVRGAFSEPTEASSIYKTKILRKHSVKNRNVLVPELFSEEGVKYVVKYNYIVEGTVDIPANCVLEFDGGSFSGGTINGNGSKVKLSDNCFDNVNIVDLESSDGNVSTNNFVGTPEFNNLVTLVGNGGFITFTKNAKQSADAIKVSKSFTVEGNGYEVEVSNSGDWHSKQLLDVENANNITVKQLIIDGKIGRKDNYYQDKPNTSRLMFFENVKVINLIDLTIINLHYYHPAGSEWHPADSSQNTSIMQAHAAMTGFIDYDTLKIQGCRVDNVTTIETFFGTSEIENCYNEVINNKFLGTQYVYPFTIEVRGVLTSGYRYTTTSENETAGRSTWVGLMKGTGIIKSNYFGACSGSAINAFLHDAEISENVLEGGTRSCAIDISEGGWNNNHPKNVTIKNNTVKNFVGGLTSLSPCDSIIIDSNSLDNTGLLYPVLRNNNGTGVQDLSYFISLNAGHVTDPSYSYNNIYVTNNIVRGCDRAFYDLAPYRVKTDIEIKNNIIVKNDYNSSAMFFFYTVNGLTLEGNDFTNNENSTRYYSAAINTLVTSYEVAPPSSEIRAGGFIQFARVHVYPSGSSEEKYYLHECKNIIIRNNIFKTSRGGAAILTTDIYDERQLENGEFGSYSNILIEKNTCNVTSVIWIVGNEWDRAVDDTNCDIKIINNNFKSPLIICNRDLISDYIPEDFISIKDVVNIKGGNALSLRFAYQMYGIRLAGSTSYYLSAGSAGDYTPRIGLRTVKRTLYVALSFNEGESVNLSTGRYVYIAGTNKIVFVIKGGYTNGNISTVGDGNFTAYKNGSAIYKVVAEMVDPMNYGNTNYILSHQASTTPYIKGSVEPAVVGIPVIKNKMQGLRIYDKTIGTLVIWNGTDWVDVNGNDPYVVPEENQDSSNQ